MDRVSNSRLRTFTQHRSLSSLETALSILVLFYHSTQHLTRRPTLNLWRRCSSTFSTLPKTTPSRSHSSTMWSHSTTSTDQSTSDVTKLWTKRKPYLLRRMISKNLYWLRLGREWLCSQSRSFRSRLVERHCGRMQSLLLPTRWEAKRWANSWKSAKKRWRRNVRRPCCWKRDRMATPTSTTHSSEPLINLIK